MPETYKSFGTILGTTAATTIYSGSSGTSIVNSVNLSNGSTAGAIAITLEAVKGSTGYFILFQTPIPVNTTLQALDSPLILEANNTLRITASATTALHAFVSVLEIT